MLLARIRQDVAADGGLRGEVLSPVSFHAVARIVVEVGHCQVIESKPPGKLACHQCELLQGSIESEKVATAWQIDPVQNHNFGIIGQPDARCNGAGAPVVLGVCVFLDNLEYGRGRS